MRTHRYISRRGFTLAELVVAAIIGALVAGAAAMSISQLSRTRAAATAHQQAYSRAEAAAGRIALDLQNAVRDPDLNWAKVAVSSGGNPPFERDELLLLSDSLRTLRGEEGSPEGDQYEAQYRVMPGARGAAGTLWRRCDPGVDEVIDGGGVATPIVPGVTALVLQAYDGTDWYDDWDSDSDGIPHAVRVVVTASSDDGRSSATVRRVLALDRVPIPPPPAEEAQPTNGANQNQPSQNSGAGAATGGGNNAGGGGRGAGRGPRGGGRGGDGNGTPGPRTGPGPRGPGGPGAGGNPGTGPQNAPGPRPGGGGGGGGGGSGGGRGGGG